MDDHSKLQPTVKSAKIYFFTYAQITNASRPGLQDGSGMD